MTDPNDKLLDSATEILPALIQAMEALDFAARYFHPPMLPHIVSEIAGHDAPLRQALDTFRQIEWPERLAGFAAGINQAGDEICASFDGLRRAATERDNTGQGYRALRHVSRAAEHLYEAAGNVPPVSTYFLDRSKNSDQAFVEKLMSVDDGASGYGVRHVHNERGDRGGYSLYVPEYYDENQAYPLIIACHGGRGNGRAFLWTWLRNARSHGAILLAPTACGETWSIMDPDIDSENQDRILSRLQKDWHIDASRILLTGMSDGGTFSYVSGLRPESQVTHLAPIAASFHPFLLDAAPVDRLLNLKFYLVHGTLDWMFSVNIARSAHETLTSRNAAVTFREIEDLSHTYPREENANIMDWFLDETVDR